MLLLLAFLLARVAAPALAAPGFDTLGSQQIELASLLANGAICHAFDSGDAAPDSDPAKHPTNQTHDCGLCPACHLLNVHVLPPAPLAVPAPVQLITTSPFILPPATGPPARKWTPARPRGPPSSRV